MTRPMIRHLTLSALLAASLPLVAQDAKTAPNDAIAKVNATGASLMPIAAGSKQLRFTALNVAKDFNDASLAVLAPVAADITSVDLARTKITDKGLAALSGMKALTELHLEGTALTDVGMDHLKGLANLEYLNLYGTAVTDAGLAKLGSLTKLKSLYLWQTKVTKAGVAAVKKTLTNTHINTGWSAEDDAKVQAPVIAKADAKATGNATATASATATAAGAKATAEAKAPAPATAATPAAAGGKLDPAIASKAVVFRDVVLPILNAKCTSCHGAEKAKGKLRLHTFADVMKGGGEGDVNVIAGKPDDSLMLQRVNLPKDDDDHMPPSDEPQLTKEEVELLKWWVAQGASESATVAAATKTPEIEGILGALLAKGLPKVDTAAAKPEKPKAAPLTEEQKKAVAAVTAKMQALGASLMPLAQDTELLRLSVINATDKFGDAQLAELAPIAPFVVWVDLARSKVTDAGLGTIGKMTALERLHLENTGITDGGLAALSGLRNLEYLNLYGTKVTDKGIGALGEIKSLKKLFAWQTGVTGNGAKALQANIPGLNVNLGLSEAEIAKLTTPPPAPPPAPAKAADKPKDTKKAENKPAPAPKPATPAQPEAKPAAKPEGKPSAPPPTAPATDKAAKK